MIKKLDKLVLKAFIAPFTVTFSVLVFIFLTQFLMNHFEDFIGKNLGFNVLAELIFYFSLNMVPNALPLSILLSSLMTFGNLGEHFELTAIKSAGISLLRVIAPIFVLTLIISIALFYYNNLVLPKVNLRAFSLLYDVKTKKMALDIGENKFYSELPGYTVKIQHKDADGQTIHDVMIYDHQDGRGNTKVILAKSGRMYTMYDGRYLVLELENGENYSEVVENNNGRASGKEFVRNRFDKSKIVINLSSFDLNRTNVDLFKSNRMMRNIKELNTDVDSLNRESDLAIKAFDQNLRSYYLYDFKNTPKPDTNILKRAEVIGKTLEATNTDLRRQVLSVAVNQARNARGFTQGYSDRLTSLVKETNIFSVEIYRKYTLAVACLVLFLIGAPLGAIIKKGGFGLPVLVSIIFFIIFYVISNTGEKWAKENVVEIPYGVWAGNAILFVVGLYFLNLARNDSNVLDLDFSWVSRLFASKKTVAKPTKPDESEPLNTFDQ